MSASFTDPSRHFLLNSQPVQVLFLVFQLQQIVDMPFLALVEVVERLPLLYSRVCVLVVGSCVSLETSSFSQLVTRPLATIVTCLLVVVRVGVATLTPVNMDFP